MVSEFVEKLGNFYEIVDENGSTIGTKGAKNLMIKVTLNDFLKMF